MTSRTATGVLGLVLLWGHGNLLSAANPLELRWNELAPLISGHVVQMSLPGGAKVRGEVAAIRDEALVLDVRSTSDAKSYPKGSATIPRASVSLLRLERERGHWGRGLGTTLGIVSGLALGGYTAAKTTDWNSGGEVLVIFVAIAGAVAVGGYFVGRALDSRTTEIRVVP